MNDNVGNYVVHDGAVITSEAIDFGAENAAYEVMRIIRGIPLFYMDHFIRMSKTVRTTGRQLILSPEELKKDIKKLLSANKADYCNVKVLVTETKGVERRMVYISESHYPTAAEADEGVSTGLFQLERQNPNAKIIDLRYKTAVADKIKKGGFFEVLLLDSLGRITEGSKSNVFLLRDGCAFTAPGQFVLKGITRRYVLEACKNAGVKVIEEFVDGKSLNQITGAFLSGTSIKVLPIKTVDSLLLDSSKDTVVSKIRQEYDKLLEKYIDENVIMW